MSNLSVQVPIRMTPELRQKLKQRADREDRKESEMARLILQRALLKEKT